MAKLGAILVLVKESGRDHLRGLSKLSQPLLAIFFNFLMTLKKCENNKIGNRMQLITVTKNLDR